MSELKDWIAINEFANIYNVHQSSVRNWEKKGFVNLTKHYGKLGAYKSEGDKIDKLMKEGKIRLPKELPLELIYYKTMTQTYIELGISDTALINIVKELDIKRTKHLRHWLISPENYETILDYLTSDKPKKEIVRKSVESKENLAIQMLTNKIAQQFIMFLSENNYNVVKGSKRFKREFTIYFNSYIKEAEITDVMLFSLLQNEFKFARKITSLLKKEQKKLIKEHITLAKFKELIASVLISVKEKNAMEKEDNVPVKKEEKKEIKPKRIEIVEEKIGKLTELVKDLINGIESDKKKVNIPMIQIQTILDFTNDEEITLKRSMLEKLIKGMGNEDNN